MTFTNKAPLILLFIFYAAFGCDADDWEEVGKPKADCKDNQYSEKDACRLFLEAEDVYVNQACKLMSVNPKVFCEMRWHCLADEPACYSKAAIKRCVDDFPTAVCIDVWQNIYPASCSAILETAPGCTIGESTHF